MHTQRKSASSWKNPPVRQQHAAAPCPKLARRSLTNLLEREVLERLLVTASSPISNRKLNVRRAPFVHSYPVEHRSSLLEKTLNRL